MRSEIDRLDREIAELRFLGLRIKELLQSMKVEGNMDKPRHTREEAIRMVRILWNGKSVVDYDDQEEEEE